MRRLFIANRGEIARRIATTAERLGIGFVVPPLDGDDAVDLLDADGVVRAARRAGADALHPGYGFLAESPLLARAAIDAGLVWVGPPPDAIAALGDKAAARATARRLGVPVPDGDAPADQSDEALIAAAARIGYPVLVKPVAGGGGKGIRIVEEAAALPAAIAAARREALRAFDDGRLLVERCLTDARHVEVQLLADRHGGVIHLGDRDCSLQRRHQKILEEAPAPGLAPATRDALRSAAIRLATAVGYEGAGTCEFLVGGDGSLAFLEMNARLQVEHPVTELILDRDLVADQLAIADGATLADLGLEQAAIERQLAGARHAVEVRLNAEDPANGFLPSTGTLAAVRWPKLATAFGPAGESGVRIDAGVAEGDAVTGRYDPLLAKVIAVGADRDAAMARLGAALDETELLGLATNLAFLRRLVRLPVVTDANARIDTVEADPDVALAARAGRDAVDGERVWAAAARRLATTGPSSPWGGGWRLNGPSALRLTAVIGDTPAERRVILPTDDRDGDLTLAVLADDIAHVSADGASIPVRLAAAPSGSGGTSAGPSAESGGDGASVRSPLPGIVIAVHVRAGTDVRAGECVATIEAMKMEHEVVAPRDGQIERVDVRPGDRVERGRVIAHFGPAATGGA